MHDDFGVHLGTRGNWSSWRAGGDLPELNIPAQVNDYIDVAIASVPRSSLLEVRLLSAKYSFEWIHHELSVTDNFQPLLNARKNDLAVVLIDDTWYRVIVLKRETASEVLVHLLDDGDEERVDFRALYKMPSSITHVPPLAFPLCVPESLWVGIRKEDLHHKLANVKLTFRLENTRNSCFTGNDFQVYDEETGALKSLKEALQQRSKLDRVNYVLAQKIKHKSKELPSFPIFTSRDQMNKRQMKRLGEESLNQGHEDLITRLPISTNMTIIEPSSEGLSVGAIVAICVSSVLSFLLLVLGSALCFHFLKKQKWRKLSGKRSRDEEKATVESQEDMESERKEGTERETRVAAGHSARIFRQNKALPPPSKQTELNSSQPLPQPAQQIAMVSDSVTAISPFDQVRRGEPEEERGSDNPPPIHYEEKVAKLDPRIIGKIEPLMTLGKMRSADDKKNHRKSSRSVDPTQISSTRPSLCLGDRQLEQNKKSELTTPDPTLKSITSIRNTSESVSSRPKHRQQSDQHENGSSLLISPAMQTTQRESDSTPKRKLKEESSMRTAIAQTDSMLSMAKRLGAGREQGVWEENSTIDEEEETDDQKISDYLVLGEKKEQLYYGTTFDNSSKPSSHRSSQPMSIHESDLEPPHFTHIKQILGTSASPPITWALTPPSGFYSSERSDAISKMKMASAPQLVQQQSLKRSRSKCFEYEVSTNDKIRVIEEMDFTTTYSRDPITAILSPVLDESTKDPNTREKITSKLASVDSASQSSSFHSAMSEGVNDSQ